MSESVLIVDPAAAFQPELWHDFFFTVGGGAAALTGLAVVAISMHVRTITGDPVLRNRARMILAGLSASFLRCSLALMGGLDGRGVGIDLFVVCLIVFVTSLFGFVPIIRMKVASFSTWLRFLGGSVCYLAEMSGAVLLFQGRAWGMTLAAVAMLANFYFAITGSWILMVGIEEDESRPRHRSVRK